MSSPIRHIDKLAKDWKDDRKACQGEMLQKLEQRKRMPDLQPIQRHCFQKRYRKYQFINLHTLMYEILKRIYKRLQSLQIFFSFTQLVGLNKNDFRYRTGRLRIGLLSVPVEVQPKLPSFENHVKMRQGHCDRLKGIGIGKKEWY